jgi:predicted thioesterase
MAQVEPGVKGSASMRVGKGDTAVALRSGDVPVLATPRVVALCEEATVAAVGPHLGAGETTVGTRVEVDHLRATGLDATVTAYALVTEVAGRRISFEVAASDDTGEIARGRVVRAVVDRGRFLAALSGPS